MNILVVSANPAIVRVAEVIQRESSYNGFSGRIANRHEVDILKNIDWAIDCLINISARHEYDCIIFGDDDLFLEADQDDLAKVLSSQKNSRLVLTDCHRANKIAQLEEEYPLLKGRVLQIDRVFEKEDWFRAIRVVSNAVL